MEIQSQDAKLVEYITLLRDNKDTGLVQAMLGLFDEIIAKSRRDNDEATGEFVIANQGKIAGMKQIKNYILQGYIGGRQYAQDDFSRAPENLGRY